MVFFSAGGGPSDAEIHLVIAKLSQEQSEIARARAGIDSDRARTLAIAQIDPPYVEVFMAQPSYGRISFGASYNVSQTQPAEATLPAVVTAIDQILDAASGTFGVRLQIDNPDGAIPARTRCKVDFDL